jgi:hypothetical protein
VATHWYRRLMKIASHWYIWLIKMWPIPAIGLCIPRCRKRHPREAIVCEKGSMKGETINSLWEGRYGRWDYGLWIDQVNLCMTLNETTGFVMFTSGSKGASRWSWPPFWNSWIFFLIWGRKYNDVSGRGGGGQLDPPLLNFLLLVRHLNQCGILSLITYFYSHF